MLHLISDAKVDRLSLRKVIKAACEITDSAVLMSVVPVDSRQSTGGRTQECDRLFSGSHHYFSLATPTWPRLRRVRGTVMADRVRLSARGHGNDGEWLPALLAAEVQMIQDVLYEQLLIVEEFNQARSAWSRNLVSRIYPRIDRDHVRLIAGRRVMSERRFRGEVDALWRKWTS